MNIYMVNETLKSRLGEGRKILSNHINNMSVTISEIVDEFGNELHLCTDVEKSIKKSLLKYYSLCIVQMLLSAIFVTMVWKYTKFPETSIKIVVDSILFLLSYFVQQRWVFKRK